MGTGAEAGDAIITTTTEIGVTWTLMDGGRHGLESNLAMSTACHLVHRRQRTGGIRTETAAHHLAVEDRRVVLLHQRQADDQAQRWIRTYQRMATDHLHGQTDLHEAGQMTAHHHLGKETTATTCADMTGTAETAIGTGTGKGTEIGTETVTGRCGTMTVVGAVGRVGRAAVVAPHHRLRGAAIRGNGMYTADSVRGTIFGTERGI